MIQLSIRTKLMVVGVGSILIVSFALVTIGAWQSDVFSTHAHEKVDNFIATGAHEDDFRKLRDRLQAGRTQMLNMLIVTGLVVVMLMGVISWLFARSIAEPLGVVTRAAIEMAEDDLPRLSEGIQAVAKGDLTTSLPHLELEINLAQVHSGDELEDIAQAFNKMNIALGMTAWRVKYGV
ncbi:MAG: HAMP domain-containing protein [Chloroflexi bacterium]|nr:HAMP domain-containing protein [Chloroflexota bacterium]